MKEGTLWVNSSFTSAYPQDVVDCKIHIFSGLKNIAIGIKGPNRREKSMSIFPIIYQAEEGTCDLNTYQRN